MSSEPTIVLVHGAFADASSWAPVTRRLLDRGYSVLAPAVPNRGLDSDAAYVLSIVEQIDGPVLLVGHSYGGAVITVAGTADNVVGLVFVAAYALDTGESVGQLQAAFPDPDLAASLIYARFPSGGTEPGMDVSVDIGAFPQVLAAGVADGVAEVLAVSQRPLAAVAFGDIASSAAWRTKPAWGLVSSRDRSINPELERFAYARAGARRVIEVDAPHLVMHTNPDEVVALIAEAAAARR
ncbi:alpha/beta hydrolase [Agreia sp. VKM Ac-1783]|uniref:alpha/beta hydrolase n=1 Tax=Agreia sp. VKM Ac-1783 TaxID=1938889 RepID=UPI000A2ACDC3|nr:alpha/beta hydrolase [Agreia sp. VKM Ac-1783]SMQ73749.1 Pimeloyl-ACP methyl ester carboxylesterase [Agreia sp. VKM Ac-1783]